MTNLLLALALTAQCSGGSCPRPAVPAKPIRYILPAYPVHTTPVVQYVTPPVYVAPAPVYAPVYKTKVVVKRGLFGSLFGGFCR